MSAAVLGLILGSAFLHAGWNFAAKRSAATPAVIWAATCLGFLVVAPFGAVALARELAGGSAAARAGVGLALASGCVQAAYWTWLGGAYRRGGLSFVYPISRGAGVVGAALGSHLLVGEPLSAAGGAGVAAIVLGVVLLARRGSAGAPPLASRGALATTLALGAAIATYTLIDDRGVTRLHPLAYLAVQNAVPAACFALSLSRSGRGELRALVVTRSGAIAAIGLGALASYLAVLFAFRLGPVGYVAAVREVAVAIGALLGVVVLKERLTPRRGAAILLVLAGIGLIRAGS